VTAFVDARPTSCRGATCRSTLCDSPAAWHGSDGDSFTLDDGRRKGRQHTILPDSRRIATGENAVSRRRANRSGSVGIGESPTLVRESVEIGRPELRAVAIARRLAEAHVVKKDKDDVGLRKRERIGLCRSTEQGDKYAIDEEFVFHKGLMG